MGGSQRRGNTRRHTYENSHGFYFQDTFRWTPRLTLNLGMRWDYFGVVGEKDNLFYRFDPSVQDTVNAGQLYDKDFNNFAPRVSFAYDVTGKGRTVIRAGWGVFYDAFAQDIFLGHFPWNCGFCPGPAYTGHGPGAIVGLGFTGRIVRARMRLCLMRALTQCAPLGEFFGASKIFQPPTSRTSIVNVQQALGSRAVLQVGYVGTKGTKLFRFRDINQPSLAQITGGGPRLCAPPRDQSFLSVRLRGSPRFPDAPQFYINQEESAASSIYHSLQTTLRMNNWRGITSQLNFVWSHAIDDASDSEDFIPNQAQPTDSRIPRASVEIRVLISGVGLPGTWPMSFLGSADLSKTKEWLGR